MTSILEIWKEVIHLQSIRGIVDTIEDMLEDGTSGTDALQTLLDALQTTADSIETELTDVTYGLSALSTDIGAVQTSIDTLTDLLITLNATKVDAMIVSFGNRISALLNNEPRVKQIFETFINMLAHVPDPVEY